MMLKSFDIFPWQQPDWAALQGQRQRLPHALLFSGLPGLGKAHLAYCLAASLLCQSADDDQPNHQPCGRCKSCQLMLAGHHPDFFYLGLEDDSQVIKVDAIRRLVSFGANSSHYGTKFVIIAAADHMNAAASNALLKTLEEPLADMHIILISHQLSRLLPTLRSRCQVIRVANADQTLARQYLQQQGIENSELLLSLTNGAPLLAEKMATGDLFKQRDKLFSQWYQFVVDGHQLLLLGKQWSNFELTDSLRCIQSWLNDIICLKLLPEAIIVNSSFIEPLTQLAHRSHIDGLFACVDQLQQKYQLLMENISLNKSLFIESMLLTCRQILVKKAV